MDAMQVARWLHVLGVVVWVGGMAFAHFALRPSAQQLLEPPLRLPLLAATLGRFFRLVAVSIAAIIATGTWWIVAAGGFGRVGGYVHAMTALGLVMIAIFVYIWLVAWRQLDARTRSKEFPAAGGAMIRIRRLVLINLVLGVITITVAMLGKGS